MSLKAVQISTTEHEFAELVLQEFGKDVHHHSDDEDMDEGAQGDKEYEAWMKLNTKLENEEKVDKLKNPFDYSKW